MFARSGEITDVLAGIASATIGGSSTVRRIFTSTAHITIVLIIVFGGVGGITEVRAGNATFIAIGGSSCFCRVSARTAHGTITCTR